MTNNATASMLTDEQIDAIANDGHRNVAGGIYAHHVHDFARDVERALVTFLRETVVRPGWKLVPIEPTEDMIANGFESWPDQFFSKPEVWASFERMSGCQRAAHKAKLCYTAMLDAAPAAPVAEAAPYFSGVSELIIRDVCEIEPANPDLSDTICIDVSDLQAIIKRHTEVCATCNGHGMIGGPSFYAPEEGGVPCPDCAQAVAADGAPSMFQRAIDVGGKVIPAYGKRGDMIALYADQLSLVADGQRAAVSPATAESKCTRCGSSTAQACNELGCFYLESGEGEPTMADERAARLDDADIDAIAESMPGGLDSFLKQWGWRQFARAVEDEVVLNGPRVQRAASGQSFQACVQPWMLECFGPTIAADTIERNHRFLEEALELVQSLGCTASEAHQLVDYTFGRPIGEPMQEVVGVMVTLAALCLASELDMHQAGETELARISEPAMVLKIRAKQAAKPKHSPLPQAVAARAPYIRRDTGPLSILRRRQVEVVTGLSRSTIYDRMKVGTFPAAVKIGPHSVGWRAGDIDAFLANPAGYRAQGGRS